MTTITDFQVTDNVTDVLAAQYNLLLGSILRGEISNATTMAGTVSLLDSDTAIQRFNCNGADRIVKLPAQAAANHPFFIMNVTAATYILTVQNAAAAVLTALAPGGDYVLFIPDGTAGFKALTPPASMLAKSEAPGGRLTLTSGTPITTADVSGATNIYYTPYTSDEIALWDGTIWRMVTFAQTTLALGTLTASLPYDVFGYLSSGVLALELLAWSTGIARATAVTIQDGRYCKSGDKTRLYLGTFYTTATTTTEDSKTKRFLWNCYNRVRRVMYVFESTTSWTYGASAWRPWNNSTGDRVATVIGLEEHPPRAEMRGLGNNSSLTFGVGIGVDVTTGNSADITVGSNAGGAATVGNASALYENYPGIGFHFFQAIESAGATGITTLYGTQTTTVQKPGLQVVVLA
jgi:hypothetical protein